MSGDIIIGVDLGGTRIRAACCNMQLDVVDRRETLTKAHEGRDATIQRIINLIHEVMPSREKVRGIGISAPGPLNPTTGVIVAPPNLPGWHNVPLGDILHKEFGVPVYAGNDANVAVLAETLVGAAHGHRNAIYITVSTGIGGGIISDGYLVLGDTGLGGEIGHMMMLAGDEVSSLEKEAAGPSLARQARTQIEGGRQSSIIDFTNGDITAIDGRAVGEAALAGDALANEIVERGGRILGLGMTTLLHIFNPEVIVVGGGVANGLKDKLLNPARQAIRQHALDKSYWEHLQIVPPVLPEDVSIVGSAALVVADGGSANIEQLTARIDERRNNG